MFGSVVHGDDCPGSDLDLLVDPLPKTTLFDLGGLQAQLEDSLGVPVDIPKRFRDDVLAEAVTV